MRRTDDAEVAAENIGYRHLNSSCTEVKVVRQEHWSCLEQQTDTNAWRRTRTWKFNVVLAQEDQRAVRDVLWRIGVVPEDAALA